ncbi:MAG: hypothetical protein MIO90_02555, partial [Methanomassiliicoccales archaeon]|nr:hypothetical protein [Methanomassiliicoccales archaeon]
MVHPDLANYLSADMNIRPYGMGMKRLAVAVLLTLFLLSTALPSVASPPPILASDGLLTSENPGLGGGAGTFDDFSRLYNLQP